jgi:hypothetical protein
MSMMRSKLVAIAFGCVVSGTEAVPQTLPTEVEIDESASWDFSLSAYTYFIEDDDDYIQTTFTADYDWLHLEARHQYEDLDTASLWVGYNLSFGPPDEDDDSLTLDFTPMIGGVFGDTDGIAPGYEVTIGWREFELYTEGEYIFDGHHSSDDFFYSWTELTYSFNDWLRAGGALQRTKIRQEDTEFEVGPMVGVTWNVLDFSAFLLYPEEGGPSVVLGLGIEF